jgi:formamidopyrimidine-DNA glycosylase
MLAPMPELPEVETTRRKIEPLLAGRTLLSVTHDSPHRYRDTHLAQGRRVSGLSRRGKYLMLHLAAADAAETDPHDLELIVHLGMTGGFRLSAGPHTRVTLTTDVGTLYFNDPRRFGKMAVVPRGEYAAMPTLHGMGPEPLSGDFQEEQFARLAAQAGAVKPWLLSQKPVSGVGNIYADEALWRARIHPAQTRLIREEAGRLFHAVRGVLAEAVEAGGSTLRDYAQHDGELGAFQGRHNVYGRGGQPCPRCGSDIRKIVLGQRGTHFCPQCQPLRTEAGA